MITFFQDNPGKSSIKVNIGKPLDKSVSIDKLNLSVIDFIDLIGFIDRPCSLAKEKFL